MKFKIYMLASVTSVSLKSENQLRHEITWKNSRKGITFYFKNSYVPVRVGGVLLRLFMLQVKMVEEVEAIQCCILGKKGDFSRRPLHGILLQN